MKRKKFHEYVTTGIQLAIGISIAVTSFIAVIILLVFFIASKI